ncbi:MULTISPECIES: YhjD/YihY/BrkB family envelope integrity protein [unclassified Streptomyces]|uniref:YhjD/YihY/BrkB family envelope integrity protein n=1 Tax=unclassified Streptomyces TaxID=2593676 RepID=UPI001F048680|nr:MULTISPECIES: YhjD/YihY/BrkB family envelope integrity protein [unclassified Streptomyces]
MSPAVCTRNGRLGSPRPQVPVFEEGTTARINRERLVGLLTFWLRPAFALRVINRFQRIVGFDRSMALASSALTALVPMAILTSAVLGSFVHYDVAEQIIRRYDLTGAGAEAINSLFSPAENTSASVGVFGAVFLTISVLSFARASQRLFEQTWELKPLSVRNTRNGLWWILTLGGYTLITGWISAVLGGRGLGLGASACEAPLTAVFLVWSGWILSARRIAWPDLVPFGVIAAVLAAVYSVGAALYLPHLFNTYAARYGVVGAVFAMLSALFAAMLLLVASAAVGRQVQDELVRIRQGRRPSEHEVRQQWESVVEQTRSRWRTVRSHVSHRRDNGVDRA